MTKKSTYQIIAIALISFGLLVNFGPVMSYYANTYIHVPHKGNIVNGSTLSFYTFVGSFYDNKSHEEFDLGLILNITSLGSDRYKIKYTIYKLLGEKGGLNPELLPKFPFYSPGGISKVVDGQKTVTSQYDLIKLLLPSKPSNGCFLNNTHTFPNKFYGFPRVLYCGHNSTIGAYTRFQNGGILLLQVLTSNITSIRPLLSLTNAPVNETDGVMMGLFLGGGNTVPPQDWAGWLKYGFGVSFPLNVGFVVIGMLMLIVASRRA